MKPEADHGRGVDGEYCSLNSRINRCAVSAGGSGRRPVDEEVEWIVDVAMLLSKRERNPGTRKENGEKRVVNKR